MCGHFSLSLFRLVVFFGRENTHGDNLSRAGVVFFAPQNFSWNEITQTFNDDINRARCSGERKVLLLSFFLLQSLFIHPVRTLCIFYILYVVFLEKRRNIYTHNRAELSASNNRHDYLMFVNTFLAENNTISVLVVRSKTRLTVQPTYFIFFLRLLQVSHDMTAAARRESKKKV